MSQSSTIDNFSEEQFTELADLLFPEVTQTPQDIIAAYPKRELPEGAWVGRFAPSPTGFIHIGGILTALMVHMIARQSDGVYILRIEDTDRKREIERGVEGIIEALHTIDLVPDEGPYAVDPINERGDFGSYIQSNRFDIYQAFVKDMVRRGLAYPCFMIPEELKAIRDEQQKRKEAPGIYGDWARSRQLTIDEIKSKLDQGLDFVVRLKVKYPNDKKIAVHDLVRIGLELPANFKDAVILKSDGFPTYHLAHTIDDTLMQVNLVLRGDEWISSIPLHIQILNAIDAPLPTYAHIAPIAKMDGNSKRKLSKRKDPEAAMSYYYQKGYPGVAILEYLMNLANSGFEDWRRENPEAPFVNYPFDIDSLSRASALFDIDKLNNVSRDVMHRYTTTEILDFSVSWAEQYAPELAPILNADREYSLCIFGVGRSDDPPRKDLVKWEDVQDQYGFFFDVVYDDLVANGYTAMPDLAQQDIADVLTYCLDTLDQTYGETKEKWLVGLRAYSADNNWAKNRKLLKADSRQYKGWFGDVMMIYRVALTGKTFSPDLFEMLQIMGLDRARTRLEQTLGAFK